LSDEEIASGTRWNERVAKALNESDFGIVCVTRANQHQPWLMFEAGALAKRLETAAVVPICVDIAPAEITGPLEAFQGRRLDEDGMRRLVHDMSKTRDDPLPGDRVNKLFDGMWPDLKVAVDSVRDKTHIPTELKRDQRDMIEELVDRVRRIERNFDAGRWPELFPEGRHIFYEGDEPGKFAQQVHSEFGFDVTKDAKWGVKYSDHTSYSFDCPPGLLDPIYGTDRFPMGS
jgi:hypothetical protein